MAKSKFLKNCLALLLITLVAGLALSFVNEITKVPIAQAEEKAKLDAYNVVFENAQFEALDDAETLLAQAQEINAVCTVDEVLCARDSSGNIAGYVMSVTSPLGYGGDIKIAVGVSLENDAITGFSVLSNSETAGLGAKCTEDEFAGQFAGKSANGIEYVKGGGASADNQIDAISGATITTNAVTEGVNAALNVYNQLLKEG